MRRPTRARVYRILPIFKRAVFVLFVVVVVLEKKIIKSISQKWPIRIYVRSWTNSSRKFNVVHCILHVTHVSSNTQDMDNLFNKLGDPGRLQVIWFFLLVCNLFTVSPNAVVGVFFGYSPSHFCNTSLDWSDSALSNQSRECKYSRIYSKVVPEST